MVSLLKILDGPWETVRGFLRLDLDHIEAAINQRWNLTFSDGDKLQPGAIQGSSTPPTRYIANTGVSPANAPTWDQVNLTNGVKNRLPLSNVVQSTQASTLLGRDSTSAGDFEQLTPGRGLVIQGTNLNLSIGQIAGALRFTRESVGDSSSSYPRVNSVTTPTKLLGYTVATLPPGIVGYLAYATDLTAPTFLANAVGGGAVIGPVFYNGTNWVTI